MLFRSGLLRLRLRFGFRSLALHFLLLLLLTLLHSLRFLPMLLFDLLAPGIGRPLLFGPCVLLILFLL